MPVRDNIEWRERSSMNRSCHRCEQHFIFDGTRPVDPHFVWSLHMDGTGYAGTWLKELGSREKGRQG